MSFSFRSPDKQGISLPGAAAAMAAALASGDGDDDPTPRQLLGSLEKAAEAGVDSAAQRSAGAAISGSRGPPRDQSRSPLPLPPHPNADYARSSTPGSADYPSSSAARGDSPPSKGTPPGSAATDFVSSEASAVIQRRAFLGAGIGRFRLKAVSLPQNRPACCSLQAGRIPLRTVPRIRARCATLTCRSSKRSSTHSGATPPPAAAAAPRPAAGSPRLLPRPTQTTHRPPGTPLRPLPGGSAIPAKGSPRQAAAAGASAEARVPAAAPAAGRRPSLRRRLPLSRRRTASGRRSPRTDTAGRARPPRRCPPGERKRTRGRARLRPTGRCV